MTRSKSSRRWLTEHFDDPYVKLAQQRGLRSRSAFKLQELNRKYGLLKGGMWVVDLGAAPGGWSQMAKAEVGDRGRVVALDLLDMEPLEGVEFIRGDFTDTGPLAQLEALLGEDRVDLVLSDMAPNMSGVDTVDQARSIYLAELALMFAEQRLRPGGDFLVKVFQGEGSDGFLQQCRSHFEKVLVRKPAASRPRSKEVYMLGRGRKLL